MPDVNAARDAAMRAPVEAIRGKSENQAPSGRMLVNVRTSSGRVLTVSAIVEVTVHSWRPLGNRPTASATPLI
ncbi:hypothetical protein [Bradyrhizobium sp. CCGB12]|uniref:hypothetical protein n=1 Tax=Bradyrhizobium sp. CCGB12 TaxID=2949632 RepID=UPI0035C202F3